MSLTKRNMTAEDFMFIMEQNKGVYPEYDALSDEKKRFMAEGNILYGSAEAYLDADGKVIGVAGVRYIGIGEAWLITLPSERRPTLLRTVRKLFSKVMDDNHLWRVFATSKISERFLRHLSFKPEPKTHVWTK